MNRFLQALRSCASSSRHSCHPVTDDLRADISWWPLFLSYYNGVSVIPSTSNPELFATDACLTGCGAFCFGESFHKEFPEFISQGSSYVKSCILMNWNCSRSLSLSSCGLPGCKVFSLSSYQKIPPVSLLFHRNIVFATSFL